MGTVPYSLKGELDRWPEALVHFQEAASERPNYLEARANLGVALAQLERWDAAVAAYQSALTLSPGDPDIHYNLGLALRALNRGAEAAAEFAQADRLRAAVKGGGR